MPSTNWTLTDDQTLAPDQLLAIAAAQSADVAHVFSDRAKAEGREALLKEMVQMSKENQQASVEQSKYFMDRAIQGVQGVAAGKGGAHAEGPAQASSDQTVECPNCHHNIPVGDRFCRICGKPMRT